MTRPGPPGADLVVEGLSKRFGSTLAVADVTFEVADGELLVVLGPTGAGKTTLLRLLAGLDAPDLGDIRMCGRSITGLPPADRDVALVFQNFSLYPDRTVRQNLAFPLRAPRRPHGPDEIAGRVAWAAGLLRITPLLDRPAGRLSGGEMQRVAIGRAIVRRPRLFLMDEPLTNLDAKLREALRIELVAIQKELGTPMVFVTHDQAEALSMADRIVVLDQGRILQQGPPEDVYLRPQTPRVARQLGYPPINILEARSESGWWLSDGNRLARSSTGEGAHALLGLRPEAIDPSGGVSDGLVRGVEDVGPYRILQVAWAGTDIHIHTSRDVPFRPGEVVRPRPDPDRLIVWPKA